MGRACKDVISVASPIVSLLATAAPMVKSFTEKTPKMPKFNSGVLPKSPEIPKTDSKTLNDAARKEMLRKRASGRESTILSDKETLGG